MVIILIDYICNIDQNDKTAVKFNQKNLPCHYEAANAFNILSSICSSLLKTMQNVHDICSGGIATREGDLSKRQCLTSFFDKNFNLILKGFDGI